MSKQHVKAHLNAPEKQNDETSVFVDGRNSKVCAKDTLVEMETFWFLLGELIIKIFLLVFESHLTHLGTFSFCESP